MADVIVPTDEPDKFTLISYLLGESHRVVTELTDYLDNLHPDDFFIMILDVVDQEDTASIHFVRERWIKVKVIALVDSKQDRSFAYEMGADCVMPWSSVLLKNCLLCMVDSMITRAPIIEWENDFPTQHKEILP